MAEGIVLQDVLILIELAQRALPRLDFNDPDQELAGNELLWLIGHIGATYERDRLERTANLKTPQYPLTARGKCGTIDVYKYTEDGQ